MDVHNLRSALSLFFIRQKAVRANQQETITVCSPHCSAIFRMELDFSRYCKMRYFAWIFVCRGINCSTQNCVAAVLALTLTAGD